jgi:predicted dehydrogenase
LAGPAAEVQAYSGNLIHERIEVEDTACAAIAFASGALGTIVATTASFPGGAAGITLSGAGGTAQWSLGRILDWRFDRECPADRKVRGRFGPGGGGSGASSDPSALDFRPHQIQFENFARCLAGKEPLLVDGQEARKAVELILAIYQAAQSRRPVALPLSKTPRLKKVPGRRS